MPDQNLPDVLALDRDTLLAEIASLENELAELKRVRPLVVVDLPLTGSRLESLGANLESLLQKEKAVDALKKPVGRLGEGPEAIAQYAEEAKKILANIADFDEKQQYPEAFAEVEKLRSLSVEDYGIPLNSKRIVKEIAGHEAAFLYAHKGEQNIGEGLPPLDEAEMKDYEDVIAGLETNLDGEKSRLYHADKLVGFRYVAAAMEFGAQEKTKDLFLAMVSKDHELAQDGDEFSPLTAARQNAFRRSLQNTFNELAILAYEGDDYEEALFYYEHREFVDENAIVESAYLIPNESDFHFAFMVDKAQKMDDDRFYDFTKSLHAGILAEDDFTLSLVGHLLASEDIREACFELMLSEVKKTNFEAMILCFAEALEAGLGEERQFAFLQALVHEKKQRGDLEKMGKSLYAIREHLAESQKEEYESLLKDLLRSPHAKRAISKSGNPAIHALIGEDINNPKLPLGKREKNTKIKSWDFMVKGLYFGLAIILPMVLCFAAYPLILSTNMEPLPKKLMLIAPVALAAIVMMIGIYRRYGFDERGSEVWGICLGIVGILVSGSALAYFILPTQLAALAPYGYSITGSGVILGVCALFMKQRKSGIRVTLATLLAGIVIATGIFIVINSINGLL